MTLRPGRRVDLIETDEPAPIFVPQSESEEPERARKRHDRCAMEDRVFIVAFLQSIIRNAWSPMMHMVQSDVSRTPTQNPRQLQVRASFKSRRGEVPRGMRLPIGVFKLMLNVEECDPHGSGEI